MLADWRDRLQRLKELITGTSRETAASKQTVAPQYPLAINLGIDFGTSFTKVCFRDVGTEETGIVTFAGDTIDDALIPSIVRVDHSGLLSLASVVGQSNSAVEIRYLKMRLADLTTTTKSHIVKGIDLNSDVAASSLASWFLATVINRARQWVLKHEAGRTKGRDVQWSANVGVPVEHYDSPAVEVFRRVLSVAWVWAMEDSIPSSLSQLISKYEETSKRNTTNGADFHAIPEIAAAVQSFIISRDAQAGVYVYFDIGGGTVDGVAFNYVNQDGYKSLTFYSAKVDSLGTAVVANCQNGQRPELFEASLIGNELSFDISQQLMICYKKLQKLVAHVVMTAKKKDGRDWLRDPFQNVRRLGKTLVELDLSKTLPLIVFLGGGGAGSPWYYKAISSTHTDFGHRNVGIPPYELNEVPKPSDLDMSGLKPKDFRRFAIAYGLSIPYGEGPEIFLPSQIPDAEPIQRRPIKSIIDYQDTKDAYC